MLPGYYGLWSTLSAALISDGATFKNDPVKACGLTLNVPTSVTTVEPAGRDVIGWGCRFAATTHSLSAESQCTQPLLLQISIPPVLLTAHAQREPSAVLSMHIPTAVLPLMANAGVGAASAMMQIVAAENALTNESVDWNICLSSSIET